MKKLLAAALTAFAALTAQASIVVTFTPASQHAQVGETIGIDMSISGLGAQIVSGFDLNFLYDPSILNYTNADGSGAYEQLGNAIGTAPVFFFDSTDNGNIGVIGVAQTDSADLAASQLDDFLMFHFDLLATADGVTSFTLGQDPDFERNFVGLDFLTLSDVTIVGACVAVGSGACSAANLPEPATLPLALLALTGLGLGVARRRR